MRPRSLIMPSILGVMFAPTLGKDFQPITGAFPCNSIIADRLHIRL